MRTQWASQWVLRGPSVAIGGLCLDLRTLVPSRSGLAGYLLLLCSPVEFLSPALFLPNLEGFETATVKEQQVLVLRLLWLQVSENPA